MNNTKLKKDVEVVHDYLARRVNQLEAKLLEACRQPDEPGARATLTDLLDASHVKRVSDTVVAELPDEPTIATYMLSTLMIQEACSVLTKTGDEDLRFATGMAVEPLTYAVTRLLQFELKRQSVVAAEGEQQAVARLMIGLHNSDHKLFMTWHSHPGSGEGSTRPSSIDMGFHRRLESGNYPVIGAIVNRQGFVRFYSYKRPFKVLVYGKGVEVINEQSFLYKLDKCGSV
jgi:hypothetical protein